MIAVRALNSAARKWALAMVLGLTLWPLESRAHPDPAHTLQQIEDDLASAPDNEELLLAKAAILLRIRHFDEVPPVLETVRRAHPGSAEPLFYEARLAWEEGAADLAQVRLTELLERQPEHAAGWRLQATIDLARGNRDAAIEAKLKVLRFAAKPGLDDFSTCAALLAHRAGPGDLEQAVEVLDQARQKIGVLSGIEITACELETKLGRYDGALARLDLLAARFRPSPDLSARRGEILLQAKRYPEAAQAFDSAVALLQALPAEYHQGEAFAEKLKAMETKLAEAREKAKASAPSQAADPAHSSSPAGATE